MNSDQGEETREFESILVFGPGGAKKKLNKCLENDKLGTCIKTLETEGVMTNRQIVEKAREYFYRKRG